MSGGDRVGRPRKMGLNYFPHDTDAAFDEKIESLRLLYRNDGYAFFFITLERIYRTDNQELDVSTDESKLILARKIGISRKKFDRILETCFDLNLLDTNAYKERKVLTSPSIKKRAEPFLKKRLSSRDSQSEGVSAPETPPETPVPGEKTPQKQGQLNRTEGSKDKSLDRTQSKRTDSKPELPKETVATVVNLLNDELNDLKTASQVGGRILKSAAKKGYPPDFVVWACERVDLSKARNPYAYLMGVIGKQSTWVRYQEYRGRIDENRQQEKARELVEAVKNG